MLIELGLLAAGAVAGGAAVWLKRRPGSPEVVEPGPTDELRAVLDTMQLGVTVTNPDGMIIYTNPADAKMHGYTPDELIGKPGSVFAPPTARKTVTTGELPNLQSWRREGMNLRKDGSVFPVRLRTDIVRDPTGKVHGFDEIGDDLLDLFGIDGFDHLSFGAHPLVGLAGVLERGRGIRFDQGNKTPGSRHFLDGHVEHDGRTHHAQIAEEDEAQP